MAVLVLSALMCLATSCNIDAQDAVMEEFEEFDEDGLVDSDDDDNSWKVRRAALKAGTAATAKNCRDWLHKRWLSANFKNIRIRTTFCSTYPTYPARAAALWGAWSDGQRATRQANVADAAMQLSPTFVTSLWYCIVFQHSRNMPQPQIGAISGLQISSFCLVQQSSCLEISASFHVADKSRVLRTLSKLIHFWQLHLGTPPMSTLMFTSALTFFLWNHTAR